MEGGPKVGLLEDCKRLMDAYGVSGNEYEASRTASELLSPYVDESGVDPWGNVWGFRSCSKPHAKIVLLDAHIDQIGFIVTGFTKDGFVRFQTLNAPEDAILGSELAILTRSGPIKGIVGCVPSSEKLRRGKALEVPELRDMFIDLGLTEAEARERVSVGDFIGFAAGDAISMATGILAARSTDDRICFMSIVRAMELLQQARLEVNVAVVGSVREEFDGAGARIRAWVDQPDFVIAADVSAYAPLGSGPIIARGADSNARLADLLEETARAKRIPYVRRSIPEVSGTNAKHYQVSARGAVTCVVSQPQKYMHTPTELVSLEDVEHVARLFAEFLRTFTGEL
jgi:putative aminopeptidase FrvX